MASTVYREVRTFQAAISIVTHRSVDNMMYPLLAFERQQTKIGSMQFRRCSLRSFGTPERPITRRIGRKTLTRSVDQFAKIIVIRVGQTDRRTVAVRTHFAAELARGEPSKS